MARDPLLRKRNALVLPGGLLVAYSLIGMAYGLLLRVPPGGCAKGEILLNGCQNVAVVLLPVLLLGAALVAVGLIRYRARPTDLEGHLHFGTGTHFMLLLFASLAIVAFIELVWVGMRQARLPPGDFVVVEAGGTLFQAAFVLQLALAGSLLGLGVVAGLYITQARLREQFLAAARQEPVDDEGPTGPVAELMDASPEATAPAAHDEEAAAAVTTGGAVLEQDMAWQHSSEEE